MRWALVWAIVVGVVLVPFFLFGARFEALAEEITGGAVPRGLAAAAIATLLALDVLLPVPSSIVSTGGGVLLGFGTGTAVVWGGMMAGCLLAYVLGARASGAAQRLVGAESLDRAHALAARYGAWTIVICRPVPVLAEASAVLAGLVRAPFRRFLALTAASNLGIAAGYAAVGAFAMRVDSFLIAFAGAVLIPGLALVIARSWRGPSDGTRSVKVEP
jgi:uncharacterized membrane protein YdjX (TVP38/TMEM64 family)